MIVSVSNDMEEGKAHLAQFLFIFHLSYNKPGLWSDSLVWADRIGRPIILFMVKVTLRVA